MKILLILSLFCFITVEGNTQQNSSKTSQPDPKKKIQLVEASCGECNFKLKGGGCNLAVKIDGKAYFVDGTSIDEHGDAHAEDGFCNAIRKAEIQGEVVNNKFKATYFKLLKPETKKE